MNEPKISIWIGMTVVKTYIESSGPEGCKTNPYFNVAIGYMLWESMGSLITPLAKQNVMN